MSLNRDLPLNLEDEGNPHSNPASPLHVLQSLSMNRAVSGEDSIIFEAQPPRAFVNHMDIDIHAGIEYLEQDAQTQASSHISSDPLQPSMSPTDLVSALPNPHKRQREVTDELDDQKSEDQPSKRPRIEQVQAQTFSLSDMPVSTTTPDPEPAPLPQQSHSHSHSHQLPSPAIISFDEELHTAAMYWLVTMTKKDKSTYSNYISQHLAPKPESNDFDKLLFSQVKWPKLVAKIFFCLLQALPKKYDPVKKVMVLYQTYLEQPDFPEEMLSKAIALRYKQSSRYPVIIKIADALQTQLRYRNVCENDKYKLTLQVLALLIEQNYRDQLKGDEIAILLEVKSESLKAKFEAALAAKQPSLPESGDPHFDAAMQDYLSYDSDDEKTPQPQPASTSTTSAPASAAPADQKPYSIIQRINPADALIHTQAIHWIATLLSSKSRAENKKYERYITQFLSKTPGSEQLVAAFAFAIKCPLVKFQCLADVFFRLMLALPQSYDAPKKIMLLYQVHLNQEYYKPTMLKKLKEIPGAMRTKTYAAIIAESRKIKWRHQERLLAGGEMARLILTILSISLVLRQHTMGLLRRPSISLLLSFGDDAFDRMIKATWEIKCIENGLDLPTPPAQTSQEKAPEPEKTAPVKQPNSSPTFFSTQATTTERKAEPQPSPQEVSQPPQAVTKPVELSVSVLEGHLFKLTNALTASLLMRSVKPLQDLLHSQESIEIEERLSPRYQDFSSSRFFASPSLPGFKLRAHAILELLLKSQLTEQAVIEIFTLQIAKLKDHPEKLSTYIQDPHINTFFERQTRKLAESSQSGRAMPLNIG